jgi:hypothetical protein
VIANAGQLVFRRYSAFSSLVQANVQGGDYDNGDVEERQSDEGRRKLKKKTGFVSRE